MAEAEDEREEDYTLINRCHVRIGDEEVVLPTHPNTVLATDMQGGTQTMMIGGSWSCWSALHGAAGGRGRAAAVDGGGRVGYGAGGRGMGRTRQGGEGEGTAHHEASANLTTSSFFHFSICTLAFTDAEGVGGHGSRGLGEGEGGENLLQDAEEGREEDSSFPSQGHFG